MPIASSERAVDSIELIAAPARVRLVPDARPETPVWAYNASVPGRLIEAKQGDRLEIDFGNGLSDPSTVHWHGIRIANAMDGVPFLTQEPVAPGRRFRYAFDVPDAGTYWYHPHLGTPEQVGRGLYGALIVHEPDPPAVDRDLVWMVDDWRLDGQARIVDDFYDWSDVAFAGRVGNTVTINGREHHEEAVARGDRIRLRLVNAANARMVALHFGSLPAWIIALDGHPLESPQRLDSKSNVFLGSGQRADLIVDVVGVAIGDRIEVLDRLRADRPSAIARLVVRAATTRTALSPSRQRMRPKALAPNRLPEPTASERLHVRMVMDGGMMREPSVPWTERAARRMRRWSGRPEADPSWSINGKAHMSHGREHPFEFIAEQGRTVEIAFENHSSHWHPMHLHGHAFRELTRNARPVPGTPWRDTTMVAPRETLVVAFVADNAGDWLIHCHILEHHAGGMGTQFRVTSNPTRAARSQVRQRA